MVGIVGFVGREACASRHLVLQANAHVGSVACSIGEEIIHLYLSVQYLDCISFSDEPHTIVMQQQGIDVVDAFKATLLVLISSLRLTL